MRRNSIIPAPRLLLARSPTGCRLAQHGNCSHMFSFIRKWAQTRNRKQQRRGAKPRPAARRLGGLEPLEDRRLMAVDAFIWFERDVPGENPAAPPAHIEIESFSFGSSNSSTGGPTTGAGKATVLDFSRTFTNDYSTPYVTYRLENVFVSSFQLGGSDGVPVENLSLNFGLIHIPRIGQEVVVNFLGGDPNQPVAVGSLFGDFTGDGIPDIFAAPGAGVGARDIYR